MKRQILFSMKNTKKYLKMSSSEIFTHNSLPQLSSNVNKSTILLADESKNCWMSSKHVDPDQIVCSVTSDLV